MNPPTIVMSSRAVEPRQAHAAPDRPLVTLILPAFNEAAIVEPNLATLCRHMGTLETRYRWEVVFVNDGSSDRTGVLAEAFAASWKNIHVVHHHTNRGLGQALQSAVERSHGDFIVVLDLDLSYAPEHIERLLTRMQDTGAHVVIASPYMIGGRVSNVPWLRRTLSVWANRFLSRAVKGNFSTLTGMVRAYDGRFLRTLDIASNGMEVNPEIIHKAMMLKARIEEVPAHLDWSLQVEAGPRRKSSLKVLTQIVSILLAGYLFRPVMFFIVPGLLILIVAIYTNLWLLAHFLQEYQQYPHITWIFDRASAAVASAYLLAPHTFIVGLTGLMVAIQLLSLGILALQSQRYFEEIFHLGTTIYRARSEDRSDGAGAGRSRNVSENRVEL